MALTVISERAGNAADKDAMQRSITSNEAMIRKFQSQLDQSPQDEQKKKSLSKKIAALKIENDRILRSLNGTTIKNEVSDNKASERPERSEKSMDDLIGEDWMMLSQLQRERFVYTAIGGLERQGVFITRTPSDYITALDTLLENEPSMRQEFLDNIFVFCVYDGEPQTRDAIQKIRNENALPNL